jgi:hypothetical protein
MESWNTAWVPSYRLSPGQSATPQVRNRTESKPSKFSLKQKAGAVVITEQVAWLLPPEVGRSQCVRSVSRSTRQLSGIAGYCSTIDDQITIERTREMIADLQLKRTLHPEQAK